MFFLTPVKYQIVLLAFSGEVVHGFSEMILILRR